ncbi:MAG: hypothetical protein WCS90_01195 [Bacilli bacterium]
MKNSDLSRLAEALLDSKIQALSNAGNTQKKKGFQGLLTFFVLFFAFFFIGLFFELFHAQILWQGEEIDFYQIGQYFGYGALGIGALCFVFFAGYLNLYNEGKKKLKEAEEIREKAHSSSSK